MKDFSKIRKKRFGRSSIFKMLFGNYLRNNFLLFRLIKWSWVDLSEANEWGILYLCGRIFQNPKKNNCAAYAF
jgi:alpha-D-ribose 1-methylphosphonate 5-triphosphate synthase subunit PhnL